MLSDLKHYNCKSEKHSNRYQYPIYCDLKSENRKRLIHPLKVSTDIRKSN